MFKILCKQCGGSREVVRIDNRNKNSVCRTCAGLNSRKTYYRICEVCGDKKQVPTRHLARSKLCKTCSSKKLGYEMSQGNIKEETEKKRYEITCSNCNETRSMLSGMKHRKTDLCTACSKKINTRAKPKLFVRTCETCGDTEMVSSKKNSEAKLCKSCRSKLPKKNKTVYPKRRKSNEVSKQAIQRARIINKEHREAQYQIPTKAPQKLSYEDMMSEYLVDNEVTVIEAVDIFIGHTMHGSGNRG